MGASNRGVEGLRVQSVAPPIATPSKMMPPRHLRSARGASCLSRHRQLVWRQAMEDGVNWLHDLERQGATSERIHERSRGTCDAHWCALRCLRRRILMIGPSGRTRWREHSAARQQRPAGAPYAAWCGPVEDVAAPTVTDSDGWTDMKMMGTKQALLEERLLSEAGRVLRRQEEKHARRLHELE